ncbi:MAG: hypothetical protein J5497_03045, partial [Selenomonadaceae bacterium]|nr:hypothetical protein [Selenomonadaceae bacterium]
MQAQFEAAGYEVDLQFASNDVQTQLSQVENMINSGANVNGMDIAMTAKESISQGYTDGIVNIAYTPEDAYAAEAKNLRDKTGWDDKIPESDGKQTYGSNTLYTGGTGRIAGEAIYIAARDININGLIQAGFNGYKASITQKDIDNAKETTFFNGELMYKVNNGGHKLGSDGYYYYEPQVYYDKTNNKLYVEDINVAGGKVYLAGRILSTGNGKIVVSDGKSNVDITNTSAVDMNVGKITNSGDGFIQIVDSAQDKLTEYSSGQMRTIENYSDWLADNSKGKVTIDAGLSIGEFVTYRPQESLTYRWAEGLKQSIVHHYHKEEKRGRWGNDDDPNYKGTYEEMTNTYNELGKPEPVKDPLGKGSFIYNDSQTDNLKLYAQNTANAWYGVDRSAAEYTTSGFFGYYHHHQHYWNKTVGTTQTYVYSLKADNPISVGIIGEKGTHSINLTNSLTRGVDLYLTGDIRNDNGAKLNISAKGGSIIQEGGVKISTDN